MNRQSRNSTYLRPAACVSACMGIALYLTAGACSFDASVGQGTCSDPGTVRDGYLCTDRGWERVDAVEGTVDDARGGEQEGRDVGGDRADAVGGEGDDSGGDQKDAGETTGEDGGDECPSEGCRCSYRGLDEGVCSDGTLGSDGTCRPPDAYVDDEGEGDCDEVDNDCDGAVDEGCSCDFQTIDRGVCGEAERDASGTCVAPSDYMEPTDDETPACDDRDNDCDGEIDEGCRCDYEGRDVGVCRDQPTVGSGCQEPDGYEEVESSCSDGVDNDCDGDEDQSDSDCNRPPGAECDADAQCRTFCVDGSCTHRIFVTSADNQYDGDIGGLSSADTNCNRVAGNAGLEGNWGAVLSDSDAGAKERLDVKAAVYNFGGEVVADGRSDLWDREIENAVRFDENGDEIETRVWTSTNADGTRDGANEFSPGQYCSDWTYGKGAQTGEVGVSTAKNYAWLITGNNRRCNQEYSLYCIDGQTQQ